MYIRVKALKEMQSKTKRKVVFAAYLSFTRNEFI